MAKYGSSKYGTGVKYSAPIFIADRMQADIDNRTWKGYFNVADINRIEANCKMLAEMLRAVGYSISIVVKTDWTMMDFPYRTEMDRIRGNVQTIIDTYKAINIDMIYPAKLHFTEINTIEDALWITDFLVKQLAHQWRYSGTFYSNQGVVIL